MVPHAVVMVCRELLGVPGPVRVPTLAVEIGWQAAVAAETIIEAIMSDTGPPRPPPLAAHKGGDACQPKARTTEGQLESLSRCRNVLDWRSLVRSRSSSSSSLATAAVAASSAGSRSSSCCSSEFPAGGDRVGRQQHSGRNPHRVRIKPGRLCTRSGCEGSARRAGQGGVMVP